MRFTENILFSVCFLGQTGERAAAQAPADPAAGGGDGGGPPGRQEPGGSSQGPGHGHPGGGQDQQGAWESIISLIIAKTDRYLIFSFLFPRLLVVFHSKLYLSQTFYIRLLHTINRYDFHCI